MITFSHSGSFKNTEDFFKRMTNRDIRSTLNRFGLAGVTALAAATPIDSGLTAESWGYSVAKKLRGWNVTWYNTNINDGEQIAILIQYGHGTATGGYIAGVDYINGAMQPIFDGIVEAIWEEVKQ